MFPNRIRGTINFAIELQPGPDISGHPPTLPGPDKPTDPRPRKPEPAAPARKPAPADLSPEDLAALTQAYAENPALLWARLSAALHSSGQTPEQIEATIDRLQGNGTFDGTTAEELAAVRDIMLTAARLHELADRQARKTGRRARMVRHEQPAAEVIAFPGQEPGEPSNGIPTELTDDPEVAETGEYSRPLSVEIEPGPGDGGEA